MGKTKGMINKNCMRKSLKRMANKCYFCGAVIPIGDAHYVKDKAYCDKCFYEGKVRRWIST
jgi:hypothetical protein